MCSGREFQVWAAATGKARLPTVASLTGGTTRRPPCRRKWGTPSPPPRPRPTTPPYSICCPRNAYMYVGRQKNACKEMRLRPRRLRGIKYDWQRECANWRIACLPPYTCVVTSRWDIWVLTRRTVYRDNWFLRRPRSREDIYNINAPQIRPFTLYASTSTGALSKSAIRCSTFLLIGECVLLLC